MNAATPRAHPETAYHRGGRRSVCRPSATDGGRFMSPRPPLKGHRGAAAERRTGRANRSGPSPLPTPRIPARPPHTDRHRRARWRRQRHPQRYLSRREEQPMSWLRRPAASSSAANGESEEGRLGLLCFGPGRVTDSSMANRVLVLNKGVEDRNEEVRYVDAFRSIPRAGRVYRPAA